MPLGPNTKKFFEKIKSEEKENPQTPFWELPDINAVRKTLMPGFEALATEFPNGIFESDFKSSLLKLSGGREIEAAIYTPKKLSTRRVLPSIVYFYGGGFCLDLMTFQKAPCATIANEAECQIIMLNPPLAPEHSAKEILDTCYEAVEQLYQNPDQYHIDKENFILAGCSSGGTIAALITNQSLSSKHLNISQQILISPLADLSLETHKNNPHINKQKKDLMLTTEALTYFAATFTEQTIDLKSPEVSPLYFKIDMNKKMPCTMIFVAEYDGLQGDGYAYEKKLRINGQNVKLVNFYGQTHNFLSCRKVLNDGDDPAGLAGRLIRSNLKLETPFS